MYRRCSPYGHYVQVTGPHLAPSRAPERQLLGDDRILLHQRLDLTRSRSLVLDRHVEQKDLAPSVVADPAGQDRGQVLPGPRHEHSGEQEALFLLTRQLPYPVLRAVRHRVLSTSQLGGDVPDILLGMELLGGLLMVLAEDLGLEIEQPP